MLVLKRKVNESLMIDKNIELVVLGLEGDVVKLGIRAPKEVEILRKELVDSIKEENKTAVSQGNTSVQLDLLLKTMQQSEG